MNWLWMFAEHRRVAFELVNVTKNQEILVEKYLRLEEDNKKLVETLAKMQEYVTQTANQSPIDLFERYQKQVLQDEPYADGKIPESAWLTPGGNEAVRTDG